MQEIPREQYEQKIRDEGGILLLLLMTDPDKYSKEKGNLQNLVEPAVGVDPEDLEQQRHDFLSFYHPGWTIDDLRSLLSYLNAYEVQTIALRERYRINPEEAADALIDLLSAKNMLIAVAGLPGSGKSEAARRIAEELGPDAMILRSDVIRRQLLSEAERYTPEKIQAVYDEMVRRAHALLQEGKTVILDATFGKENHRASVRALAEKQNVSFHIVEVTCDDAIVRERMPKRIGDASEATLDSRVLHQRTWEHITDPHTVLDNSRTIAELQEQVRSRFKNMRK